MRVTKQFPFDVKAVAGGSFKGRASVYGVVDAYGDVVMPGAFAAHLKEKGNRIVVLNQHDAKDPIGYAVLTDSPTALLADGQLVLDLPSGKDMYTRLQNGLIDGLSIGYEVVDEAYVRGTRQLKAISLWEISLVTFPANAQARVTDVKTSGASSFAAYEDVRQLNRRTLSKLEACVAGMEKRFAHLERRIPSIKAATTLTGIVSTWTASGTGHVAGDDGRTYFIPLAALDGLGVNFLYSGQKIEFETTDGETVSRVLRLIMESDVTKSRYPFFTAQAPATLSTTPGINVYAELKGRR